MPLVDQRRSKDFRGASEDMLLLEIMCADLNVCKSMLLRGAYDDVGHACNLVQIHEDKYVVDVVREPGEIYHPETKKPGVTKFANAAAVASSPFL